MNLTYQLTEKGYIILKDGVAWITQEGFIPFPKETLALSAEAHIQDIIDSYANPPQTQDDRIANIEIALANLMGV